MRVLFRSRGAGPGPGLESLVGVRWDFRGAWAGRDRSDSIMELWRVVPRGQNE